MQFLQGLRLERAGLAQMGEAEDRDIGGFRLREQFVQPAGFRRNRSASATTWILGP
ncbi:MAG: hypothetical protein R3F40_17090 [Candidatus Competibacteraceae bacterium]